jgi:hypothetical protein
MTETQQRFLRAIAERVPSEQVVEVHLFPPIRQGGVETGVAVVAEDPVRVPVAVPVAAEGNGTAEAAALANHGESGAQADGAAVEVVDVAEAERAGEENDAEAPPTRFTIYTARYRLTLKGVDRGKWEVDVVAEADAPLDAVDAVVRGVQRRAGEGAEPDRLSAEAFRDALEAPLAQLER